MAVLSKHQQRVVGLVVLGGSALVGGKVLQLNIRKFQKEQSALCEIQGRTAAQQALQPRKAKVGQNLFLLFTPPSPPPPPPPPSS